MLRTTSLSILDARVLALSLLLAWSKPASHLAASSTGPGTLATFEPSISRLAQARTSPRSKGRAAARRDLESRLDSSTTALHGVSFTNVSFSDTFWRPRIATNHSATIPHLLRELEKQGSLSGFRRLAGNPTEKYHGYIWGDSDVYKTLEGIVAALCFHRDPALERQLEAICGTIVAAQARDGYLFPHLQITEPAYRHFTEETTRTCESYSMGHLIESAVEYYRLTGRTNLLNTALRAAELVRQTHAGGALLRVSGHPEIELALIKLSEVAHNPVWLNLAGSLIENARRVTTAWSQSNPPLSNDQAQGHAVAMLYLYSAATDWARLKGDAALADLMRRKWTNVISRKLYLTGGLGHNQHGEGFAQDYDLPNDLAYCETCAAIANVFWQHRMFLAHGDAACIDVLERSLYNNVLAGLARQGNRFFYVNPLAADGRTPFNRGVAERFAWTDCPCCPVNLVRFIPRVGDYFYAVRDNAVFINLFGENQTSIRLPTGEVRLRQSTRYPWDGRVRIEIAAAPKKSVAFHVRVPGWAVGHPVPTDLYHYAPSSGAPVILLLNGLAIPLAIQNGYAVLNRTWRSGDLIELDLPMPVRRVLAHEKVKDDASLVAVERGPLVYCVEGVDHQGRVLDLALPDSADFTLAARSDFLGGITVIDATGRRLGGKNSGPAEPAPLRFIPYNAWNHRGAGPMRVWLARIASDTRPAHIPSATLKPKVDVNSKSNSQQASGGGQRPK